MTIDDVPLFNKDSGVRKLTALWGWLGPDAALDILDALAEDIHGAIEAA